MIILDTSAIIEILRGTQKTQLIREQAGTEDVSITSLSVHELMIGVREKEIPSLMAFLSSVTVKSFDFAAAFKSAEIEKQLTHNGRKIEESDIFIAGICMASNAKLITLDKDFESIEGLNVAVL